MSSDRAALAALAGEVEALRRQVDTQQRDLAQVQESADHAHRVVVEIVDRVKAIADRQSAQIGRDPAAGAPASWLSIEDPASARLALAELADWLTRVYVHYPGSLDSLGECWPWDPAAVEELLALRGAWLAAHTSPDASAARALDWHDRHLPGVQRRLRTALGDCSLAAHPPRRPRRPAPPHHPRRSRARPARRLVDRQPRHHRRATTHPRPRCTAGRSPPWLTAAASTGRHPAAHLPDPHQTRRPASPSRSQLLWPPNVWVGVSVETTAQLHRLDQLRTVPAAVRFLSAEPLLGPLDGLDLTGIGWVIAGGESGPAARPMHAEWVRQVRGSCQAAAVPFFFKQWGGRTPKAGGRLLDGRTWNQQPREVSC